MIISFIILIRLSVSFENFDRSLVASRARYAKLKKNPFDKCFTNFTENTKTLQWHETQKERKSDHTGKTNFFVNKIGEY